MTQRRRLARTNWAAPEASTSRDELRLPLTREEVLAAETLWGGADRDAWVSQWSAIQTLADDIWRTADANVDRLHRLWVSLAYSVGNFKRQGNTTIHPLPAPWRIAPLPGETRRRHSLSVPVGGTRLQLFREGTTQCLGDMTSGLASVPTGSTILSALWPDDHVIMDWRNFEVTVGLLAHQGASILPVGSTVSLNAADWAEYRWFRSLVQTEAERLDLPSPVILERALYVARDFAPPDADDIPWSRWGGQLKSGLAKAAAAH